MPTPPEHYMQLRSFFAAAHPGDAFKVGGEIPDELIDAMRTVARDFGWRIRRHPVQTNIFLIDDGTISPPPPEPCRRCEGSGIEPHSYRRIVSGTDAGLWLSDPCLECGGSGDG